MRAVVVLLLVLFEAVLDGAVPKDQAAHPRWGMVLTGAGLCRI